MSNIGYTRNNTDYIPESGTETGFINKAEAVELIKNYVQDLEFYEIEPAEVIFCHLDPTAPNFPKIGQTSNPDLSKMGCIEISPLHSESGGGTLSTLVKPLSKAIVQYPLKGEVVNVAEYKNELYYYNPLNSKNKVSTNFLPGRNTFRVSKGSTSYNRTNVAKQGDTLIQSRFGSTIHFGSDKDYKEPNIKITCGQNKNSTTMIDKDANEYYPHVPNINADGASIWMTTNEHIGLSTGAPSNMKQNRLGGAYQSVIVSNADTQAINARNGDVSAFAERNINFAANGGINLESEFGDIKLGSVDTNNPAVLGDQLKDFLKTFLDSVQNFAETMVSVTDRRDQVIAYQKLLLDVKLQVDELQEKPSFHSNKVFIRENHNPPDVSQELDNQISKEGSEVDELDLESMWDDVKWNEIEDVVDVNYEVEKVTATAGVRG